MVRVGGHIMMRTPSNNQCGHGFYQFSPELFFRIFTPVNGFELVRIYMVYKKQHYHVVDPASLHGRVELISSDSAFLMINARKIGEGPEIIVAPQQSDYFTTWDERKQDRGDGRVKRLLRSTLSHA